MAFAGAAAAEGAHAGPPRGSAAQAHPAVLPGRRAAGSGRLEDVAGGGGPVPRHPSHRPPRELG